MGLLHDACLGLVELADRQQEQPPEQASSPSPSQEPETFDFEVELVRPSDSEPSEAEMAELEEMERQYIEMEKMQEHVKAVKTEQKGADKDSGDGHQKAQASAPEPYIPLPKLRCPKRKSPKKRVVIETLDMATF